MLHAELEPNSSQVKAYATKPENGLLAITLINKGADLSVIKVSIDGAMKGGHAMVFRLSAPVRDAKTGITLGGAEINLDGRWKPSKPEVSHVRAGKLGLNLPAYSAAILHFA